MCPTPDKVQEVVEKVKEVALGQEATPEKKKGPPANAKPKGEKKQKKKGGDAADAGAPLEVVWAQNLERARN